MDFKDFTDAMQKSRAKNPEQFDKDMAEDRRAAARRDKVEERYDRMLQRKAAAEAEPKSYEQRATEKGLKIPERPVGRGASGRAMDIDMGGGLRPGQSPSLENPIKQAKGGKVKANSNSKSSSKSSASSRADGIAARGKTRGKMY